MAEILEVVFRSGWTFAGTFLLALIVMSGMAAFKPFEIKINHYHKEE